MPRSNKAAKLQKPPPEELRTEPTGPMNETYLAAYRLACANIRESASRSVQVDGCTEAVHYPKDIKPLWYQVARFVIRKGVTNMERYVRAQYRFSVIGTLDEADTLSTAPNPGSFDSKRAYDRYEAYNARVAKVMEYRLKSEHTEFECCVDEAAGSFPAYTSRELWRYVLMNRMLDLSSLFRYCVAVSERLDEPTLAYRSSALLQFLSDPMGYSAVWETIIPKALKDDASAILLFAP